MSVMPRRLAAFLLGLVLAHASVLGAWRACATTGAEPTSVASTHAAHGGGHDGHRESPGRGHEGMAACTMATTCGLAAVASADDPAVEQAPAAHDAPPAFDRRAPALAAAAPEPPPPRA